MKTKRKKGSEQTNSSSFIEEPSSSGRFLRYVQELFQAKQAAKALEAVDRRLAHETDPVQQARLLGLVADFQIHEGKFTEAIDIFNRAIELTQNQSREWLRPGLGLVRGLLKNVQVDQAREQAWQLVRQAEEKEQAFEQSLLQAAQQVQSQGSAVISEKPFRTSVVATRLAKSFIQEGEEKVGKELLEYVVKNNPDGASRARQLLGLLALQKGDWTAAWKWTREAIVLGEYQARTICCWPIYLTARHQLNQPGVEPELWQGLQQSAPAIFARALLSIVTTLRAQNQPQWQTMANEWLQGWEKNPNSCQEIAVELRKIQLAELKHTSENKNNNGLRLQQAQQLLQMPSLSPVEWIGAAKEMVSQSLQSQQAVNVEGLLMQGQQRFQGHHADKFRHSLALACLQGRDDATAQNLFQTNIEQLSPENKSWGQSLWQQAKLQARQNHAKPAGEFYFKFYQQAQSAPERLRLYALIEAARQYLIAEDKTAILQLREPLSKVVVQINDYELLLDLARQLVQAPTEFNALAQRFLVRGKQLAQEQFQQTQDPALAATILFKFSRRLNDFGDYQAIVETWRGLNGAKRNWLWQTKQEFWQYLGYVYQALWEIHFGMEAEQLAKSYLQDPATPIIGQVELGVAQAIRQIGEGRTAGMFEQLERLMVLNPMQEICAAGWYWLAIRAWKQGQTQQALEQLKQVERILKSANQLAWKKELLEKSGQLRDWLEGRLEQEPEFIREDLVQARI